MQITVIRFMPCFSNPTSTHKHNRNAFMMSEKNKLADNEKVFTWCGHMYIIISDAQKSLWAWDCKSMLVTNRLADDTNQEHERSPIDFHWNCHTWHFLSGSVSDKWRGNGWQNIITAYHLPTHHMLYKEVMYFKALFTRASFARCDVRNGENSSSIQGIVVWHFFFLS